MASRIATLTRYGGGNINDSPLKGGLTMQQKLSSIVLTVALLLTAGCALNRPPTQREQITGIGGLGGGLAGAIIGSVTGSAVAGGLVGLPLGALAGYYIGDHWSIQPSEARAQEKDTEVTRLREENARLSEQLARADSAKPATQSKAEQTPVEDKASETERQSVLFGFNQASLDPNAKQTLSPIVKLLKENSNHSVVLNGYSDAVGADAYNVKLSQRRAEAVKNYFVQNGISAEKIRARGLGGANPIASNDTETGRRQNRRVEVVISKGEQRTAAGKDNK
jgi:outer membrane protein OmpA-like peptidoglycan-associated protein